MLTFEIVEGSLRISNVTSVILLISKQFVYVNTLSLQNAEPRVEIYNVNLGTNAVVFAQPLSQCLDSAGNPFTVDSFILFAEVNLGFNGGGTPQPITPLPATSVKYAELVNLINESQLVPNTNYLITDYATIYDQPDYGADGLPKPSVATVQGQTEPLIVYAISVNQISNVALSTVYPNDIIFYNWDFQYTEYMNQDARGRITKRISGAENIETGYDFRAVVYKRYQDPTTLLYTVVNDNEQDSLSNIPTFGSDCNNIVISNVRTGGADEPIFFMPNSVFGANCSEISTLDNFYNNTIGNDCQSNTFGYLCVGNVIGNGFANNRILNYFSYNTIGNKVYFNNILNNFQNNTIESDFFYNIIGNNFGSQNGNIIKLDFSYNNILGDFYGNSVEQSFNRNQIFREFYENLVKANFANNQIYAEIANRDFDVTPNVFYTKPNVQVITGFDDTGNPSGQPFYGYFIFTDKTMSYGVLNQRPWVAKKLQYIWL